MRDAEHRRERVDDALWVAFGVFGARSDRPGRWGTLGPGLPSPPTGLEAIDAFEAVGLLDPVQAGAWRERVSAPPPPSEPAPDLLERLRAYLADRTREALAAPRSDDAWFRPQTLLHDLGAAGLIDDDERAWWFSLLAPGVVDGPPLPRARLDRFVRCVPGPAERRRGLRLLSVDLFEDGACLHLQLARRGRDPDGRIRPLPDELEPHAPLAPRDVHVRVEDDLGTAFRALAGGGGGGGAGHADGPLALYRSWTFAPAVPEHARRLVVATSSVSFEVLL